MKTNTAGFDVVTAPYTMEALAAQKVRLSVPHGQDWLQLQQIQDIAEAFGATLLGGGESAPIYETSWAQYRFFVGALKTAGFAPVLSK